MGSSGSALVQECGGSVFSGWGAGGAQRCGPVEAHPPLRSHDRAAASPSHLDWGEAASMSEGRRGRSKRFFMHWLGQLNELSHNDSLELVGLSLIQKKIEGPYSANKTAFSITTTSTKMSVARTSNSYICPGLLSHPCAFLQWFHKWKHFIFY